MTGREERASNGARYCRPRAGADQPLRRPRAGLAATIAVSVAAVVLGGTAAPRVAVAHAQASSPSGTGAGAPRPPSQEPGSIAFAPCVLTHPTHVASVEAECGRLAVPENPAEPRGRQIELFVARVPAVSLHRQPDALFVLAGGPGMAATTFYTEAAGPLARIHRDRDIILVDQRGTGRSNGLFCNMDDDSLWRASDATLAAAAHRCLEALSRHADVAYYTTSLAVRDLDRVRAVLGYPTIDLYGVSYGTRVALHYLRRYPRHVRAVIVDGVVPPQQALGATLPIDAQAALDRIFARCVADAACHGAFGDPAVSYRALRDALDRRAVTVRVANPTTGEPASFDFTALHLSAVLRLASYTSEQAALLPLALHEAAARGDFGPLASQFLLVDRTYEDALAYGMHNTVVCTEDVPFYGRETIDRARLERTYLGTSQLDALERVCAAWPHGPIDPDFHAPLQSSTPVMLLSGTDDPVTPPANAELVARGLAHHVVVALDGMGHGQLAAPCVDRLMARFIERGAIAGLDVSCARRVRPFPFFTSFDGPPP
jgi:pimeloyl-ACP methyl ester carboxylesterase